MLLNKTTNGDEADDIFSEFCLYILEEIEQGNYQHSGNFDGWIASTWETRFLPKKKRDLYKYTTKNRFVNNDDPKSPGYKHAAYCVNTEKITSDSGMMSTDRRWDRRPLMTEAGSPHKITDQILRDLDDPNTELGQLDADTRKMLLCISEGMSHEDIAENLGCSVRTVGRKLKAVKGGDL